MGLISAPSYRRIDLYNLVADVGSYHNFVPYCTGSRILERRVDQDGVVKMDAELMVGFLAFNESYVSRVTCRPYESVQVSLSRHSGGVHSHNFLKLGRGIEFNPSLQDPSNNMALPTSFINITSPFQWSTAP